MLNKTIKLLIGIGACALLLCACKENRVDTLFELNNIKSAFSSSLTSVSVYTSKADEGEDGHIDQGLIAALLGKGGELPAEMSGIEEYSFFCASSVELCEVWVANCRTYSAARALSQLFEKRRAFLSKIDFDSESDAKAAISSQVLVQGKTVYFISAACGDDIAAYVKKNA